MNKILNYLDFKSIDVSVRYLSISAFFTGVGLGYFFTLIVILLKHNNYSESTIGIIAAFFFIWINVGRICCIKSIR